MPEPLGSSDAVIYQHVLNPLARNMCFVHPNFATFACFLTLLPIAYFMLSMSKFSVYYLIILVAARSLLDMMDGALARQCKKTSRLGEILDVTNDFVSTLVLSGVACYVLRGTKYFWVLAIFIAFVVSILAVLYVQIVFLNSKDPANDNIIIKVLHDNTVICYIAGAIIFKVMQRLI